MDDITLPQAAASNNITGALQQLLMQRLRSPQQAQQVQDQRQQALADYQNELRAPPMGGYTGTEHSLYNWIGSIPRNTPTNALMHGIAAGGDWVKANAQGTQQGRTAAAKVGYEDAVKEDAESLNELRNIAGLSKSIGRGNSPTVKMDKDGNMVVYDPSTGETKVVHSSQGAAYQRIWGKAYEQAVANDMPNPESYAHGVAANVLGKSPTASVNPPQQPADSAVSGPTSQLPGNAQPAPMVGGSPSPAIAYKDKAEEARKKEYATESEKLALKDYDENVKVPGQVAESTLNNIGMLRQIPRTQDMFAPYREQLGAAMGAMGLDGKMATEAENLQQVRPILAKIANDRLLLAKGVQTEGDAQRAFNEFVKITDTQKAADFMYAWAEELANRAKFKKQVYELSAKEKGTMREGSSYWDKTDYARAAPVAILNGRPWTYTAWKQAFAKANPDASAADLIETWNSLARRK